MPIVSTSQRPEDLLDGPTIRKWRTLYGWTQRGLALRTGLSSQRIWKFENNVEKPRVEEMAAIVRALSTGPQAPARSQEDGSA